MDTSREDEVSKKELSRNAYSDAFASLMLAKDMAGNAQYSKWKWALVLAMVEAIVKSLWAIYFNMMSDE